MGIRFPVAFVSLLMAGAAMIGCNGEVSSQNAASVNVEHRTNPRSYDEGMGNLAIYDTPEKYTYENFLSDLHQLERMYGDQIRCIKLCDTHDGRGVYDIILGDPGGKNQILIFASMHAREYITTQVVMRQLCDALRVRTGGDASAYRGVSRKSLLESVTVHFVPLNNPDGVAISQFGLGGVHREQLRKAVASMAGNDYEQWKANAVGVDLNRNFDAGWQEFGGSPIPASERYKGAYPGSEPEAAALIDLTKRYPIRRAISYHTCGALIYWYYKQKGDVLAESRRFASLVEEETGYPLDDDYTSVDAAGFKDWAVYRMGIPSVTIEVGAEHGRSIVNPVPIGRFTDIWARNKNVVYAAAYSLQH